MIPSDKALTDKALTDKALTDKADKMRPTTRLAAVPGAFGAVLLIGAVAFGATSLRPSVQEGRDQAAAAATTAATTNVATAGDVARAHAHDPNAPEPKPSWTPDREKATSTLAPTEKPTPTEKPKPDPTQVKPLGFDLDVLPGEGIRLAWEACTADGFTAYKIVRSKVNADPRFPLNDGTELIAVIGDPGQVTFVDSAVSAGEAWTYRVVAVKATFYAISQVGGGAVIRRWEHDDPSAVALLGSKVRTQFPVFSRGRTYYY